MALPFGIDVQGEFGPGQLEVIWRDEPRSAHAELDAFVARVWAEQCKAAQRNGQMLFNGPLARLLRFSVAGGTLLLEVGPTDYANFMATNLLYLHETARFGPHLRSDPVGTSALPVTSDGWLLCGRRSGRVAFHAGFVHVFGGGLEAGDRREDGSIDAFESVFRELWEELHVNIADIVQPVCLGLIRDPAILQPELTFEVPLRLERSELAGRLDPHASDQEHTELVWCRDHPEAILKFLAETRPITPVAVGAFCLHGRRRFGEDVCRL